jgi:hypothetical protein
VASAISSATAEEFIAVPSLLDGNQHGGARIAYAQPVPSAPFFGLTRVGVTEVSAVEGFGGGPPASAGGAARYIPRTQRKAALAGVALNT